MQLRKIIKYFIRIGLLIFLSYMGLFIYKRISAQNNTKEGRETIDTNTVEYLEKLIPGYEYDDILVSENIEIIVFILNLVDQKLIYDEDMVRFKQLLKKTLHGIQQKYIEEMVGIWVKYKDSIIYTIKEYNDKYNNKSLDTSIPEKTIYKYLNEFLNLCIPRTAKYILENAFNNILSPIGRFKDKQKTDGDKKFFLGCLYVNNLIVQLSMFIKAIKLTNKVGAMGRNLDFIVLDRLVTNVIHITLKLKENEKTINLCSDINPDLPQRVIKIIKQYIIFFEWSIKDIDNNQINTEALIKLIEKTYHLNNTPITSEERQIKKILYKTLD